MEEFTDLIRDYLGNRRNIKKQVFKLSRCIYRGVNNNRFTFEQAEAKLWEGRKR